jgi:dynein heavy chain
MPHAPEDHIVLTAIKDVNLPKFVQSDIEIFKAILSDLFPELVLEDRFSTRMDEILLKNLRSAKMSFHAEFKSKVYQLYEMIKTRHGLMLVGEAMTGKTTIIKSLAACLTRLEQEGENEMAVNFSTLNPKAITINEMFGFSDPISQEWTEGILSFLFRGASKKQKNREWLVLDGPVDADWIENMNTVLDDNRCLCLMSSDKIPMSKHMAVIFETENLAKASPATVSRCGMIYLNNELIGSRPYFLHWMESTYPLVFDQDLKEHLIDLFDSIFKMSIKYLEGNCKHYQHMSELTHTQSMLKVLQIFFTEAGFIEGKNADDEIVKSKHILNILFVMAISWSMGMTILEPFRKPFDKNLRRMVSESIKSETKADRIIKFEKDVCPPESAGLMM